jgi:hypothetical protein
VQANTAVGLLMMLVLPVGLVGGAFLGEIGNKELGAVMVAIGLLPGLGLAFFGYRVIRGISLSEVPGLFLMLGAFVVFVFAMANCPAQPG